MINDKKVLVVIPARQGSKGLPNKNIKVLRGKPLIAWPICAALNSKYVDKITVSTDDIQIADIAKQQGVEIPFFRPKKLALDTTPTSKVLLHAIEYLESNDETFYYIILLEPTSPLTETSDVDHALEMLEKSTATADSIVGVSEVRGSHPAYCVSINKKGLLKSYQKANFTAPIRRQELEELYFFDGSLYISKVSVYKHKKSFYHNKTLPYLVPVWKSLEIDTLFDFILIEAILKNMDIIKINSHHIEN